MKKYIGTLDFYKRILIIAIPIMLQNGITNFVGLLDNIMVGQIGTDQMSGVAIVNQLLFVFNLTIFGGLSGAGIFTTQYYGKSDHEGVKQTFRFKLMLGFVLLLASLGIFWFLGSDLISQFLHTGSKTGNLVLTKDSAVVYLKIMMIGLIPFTLNQCYVSTLRETGKTIAPMTAGIIAVFINLLLNYILIFGKWGAPELGVAGAAIATVISRFAEAIIILLWTHLTPKLHPFMVGLYHSFYIPRNLIKNILIKGSPLMVNEILWSASVTVLTQRYSTRGLAAVAAVNICNTINNLFNVIFIALGCSVAIVVGQLLGADKMEEAKDTDNKMIAFTVAVCFVIGVLMAVTSPLFPKLYNTSTEVRSLATGCICIMAVLMPFCAFNHASYFTLRSGGQTYITFLFDSCFMWVICVPVAFFASKTSISLLWLFGICQSLEIVKCFIGFILIKKNGWLRNIVKEEP